MRFMEHERRLGDAVRMHGHDIGRMAETVTEIDPVCEIHTGRLQAQAVFRLDGAARNRNVLQIGVAFEPSLCCQFRRRQVLVCAHVLVPFIIRVPTRNAIWASYAVTIIFSTSYPPVVPIALHPPASPKAPSQYAPYVCLASLL